MLVRVNREELEEYLKDMIGTCIQWEYTYDLGSRMNLYWRGARIAYENVLNEM